MSRWIECFWQKGTILYSGRRSTSEYDTCTQGMLKHVHDKGGRSAKINTGRARKGCRPGEERVQDGVEKGCGTGMHPGLDHMRSWITRARRKRALSPRSPTCPARFPAPIAPRPARFPAPLAPLIPPAPPGSLVSVRTWLDTMVMPFCTRTPMCSVSKLVRARWRICGMAPMMRIASM